MNSIEAGTKSKSRSPKEGLYKQHIAYNKLKQAIISYEFKPGKILVERELTEMLGVSRTPVREALRRLSSEGLVESRPGKGVFVTSMTQEDAIFMFELKDALERKAARLCCRRMTGKEHEALRACMALHEKAYLEQDYNLTADLDLKFHELIVVGAKSPKIEEHAKSILLQTRRLSHLEVLHPSFVGEFIDEHRTICDAICNKDEIRSEEAITSHIDAICSRLHLYF